MRKQPIFIILIILTTLLSFSLPEKLAKPKFDYASVKNTASYLSSSNFKGRLAGTIENAEAAQYIETAFKNNGLAPYKGNYYQSFEVSYPKKINQSPYLKVVDNKGKLIHEYQYDSDFREDMLNFKVNSIKFKQDDSVHIQKDSITIINDRTATLFFSTDTGNTQFRSSFFTDSPINLCVILNKTALESLKKYISQGYTAECYVPYQVQKTSINNIIGVVKGKDSTLPPVIVSAHFDHVGTDLGGNIYSGALDNASGTAFMLEMVKYVKSLGTPERNIIFIGFNAEEFGCLGSKAFVDKNKSELVGSKVFNFDMVGSDYGVPLCIMGAKTDTSGTSLIKSTAAICSNNKIHFNYLFEDASDHEYFRKNNIDAITFCDNDTTKIHTPLDQANYISEQAIQRCFSVASKEILKYGYDNNPAVIYKEQIIRFSLLSVAAVLVVALFISLTKNKRSS